MHSMAVSQLRSTASCNDTSLYPMIDSNSMHGHRQMGHMAQFSVDIAPALLPQALLPMPLPKSRRIVSAAFVSGAAPLRDRARPLTLGSEGFLRTISGPRSPIGARKASEIQLVNTGAKNIQKSVSLAVKAKDKGTAAQSHQALQTGSGTGKERERMRLERRQSVSLPNKVDQSPAYTGMHHCCSVEDRSADFDQSSIVQVHSTRPYSTSSVVNPNSLLLSPPSSPELSYRKLDLKDLDNTKPFELPPARPCSEPAVKPGVFPPTMAEISSTRPRQPFTTANRVAKLARSKAVSVAKSMASNSEARVCYSCGAKESPCWRPSWSAKCGQLCNSCGLRYRKTRIYCPSMECRYVPSKIELAELRANPSLGMKCPRCTTKLHLK